MIFRVSCYVFCKRICQRWPGRGAWAGAFAVVVLVVLVFGRAGVASCRRALRVAAALAGLPGVQ
jgi:hypothetical protein